MIKKTLNQTKNPLRIIEKLTLKWTQDTFNPNEVEVQLIDGTLVLSSLQSERQRRIYAPLILDTNQ
jgi:hypothetical protein